MPSPEQISAVQAFADKLPGLHANVLAWKNNGGLLRLLEKDSSPVAFIAFRQDAKTLNQRYIGMLGVDPRYQRQGFAKSIIESVLREPNRGADIAYLEVRNSNKAAINLYRRIGFKDYSVLPNHYGAPQESGIRMYFELVPDGLNQYLKKKSLIS